MTFDDHLETEFRRYFPDVVHFFIGANDDDCLTINADSVTFIQTEDNMGSSDADYFVFVSDETNLPLTLPFGTDLED